MQSTLYDAIGGMIEGKQSTRRAYGMRTPEGKVALTCNKRKLLATAKQYPGSILRSVSYQYFKACGFSMDWPTFYAVSIPLEA